MGEFEAACNRGEILTKEEQKAHAQEKAEKAEHKKTEEQKKPTFNKYAELFIKEKAATLSATTIQSYKQALKRPAAVFGEIKLEDIDFLMVKQFITDLQTTKAESGKKPLAHGTIVTYYTTLHTLFESAVENGVIVQNPMQRMKKPKLHQPQQAPTDNTSEDTAARSSAELPTPRKQAILLHIFKRIFQISPGWYYFARFDTVRHCCAVPLKR